jgi:hypothetical protein
MGAALPSYWLVRRLPGRRSLETPLRDPEKRCKRKAERLRNRLQLEHCENRLATFELPQDMHGEIDYAGQLRQREGALHACALDCCAERSQKRHRIPSHTPPPCTLRLQSSRNPGNCPTC